MNRHMRCRAALIAAIALLATAGCSSGSGDAVTSTSGAPTTPTAATPSTASLGAAVTSLAGELVWTESGDNGNVQHPYTFELATDGSYRVEETGKGNVDWAFDAVTRRAISVDEELNHLVTTNTSPGEPDYFAPPPLLERIVAEVVTAKAAAGATTDTTFLGRRAWKFHGSVGANELAGESAPTEIDAVVDQETHLALQVTRRRGGKLVSSLEVKSISAKSSVDRAKFRFGPDNDSVATDDQGWRVSSPADARSTAGFVPFAPATLPSGFAPATVSLNPKAQPTGPEASNPADKPAIAFAYRRGFDVLNVTTRPTGDEQQWSNPFGTEGSPVTERTVRLKAGSLSGADAHVSVDLPFLPHLYVVMPDRVFTISGPLSSAQLVAIAESLAPPA